MEKAIGRSGAVLTTMGMTSAMPLHSELTAQLVQASSRRCCVKYVGRLLGARLAHRWREEGHRDTIRACSLAMQNGAIGPAHAELHRVDSRGYSRFLREEPHVPGAQR